jgi:hypothetical protein
MEVRVATLTKADKEKLRTFERIILRIYGPTCENGVWKIKYNDELYGLYEDLGIVKSNKSSQVKMARIFSQNGGKHALQKDKILAA